MSMSTPIHQLPTPPPQHSAKPVPTDDPEVLSMLSEMEKEVQEATMHQAQHMNPPPPQPMFHAPPPPPMVVKKASTANGLWNPALAQKAVVYAVIAMILFYPGTLNFVYSKLPKFEAMFSSYDTLIRTALLAVALYAALLFLPF